MTYAPRIQDIINTLAFQHPDLVQGDDDQRRELTTLICQQTRFEFGPNWGTKRADPGRPLSVDVMAFNNALREVAEEPILFGWDMQISGGIIAQFPASIDLTGQVFVPVEPINHLGAVPTDPPVPPGQPIPPEIIERLDRIEALVNQAIAAAQAPVIFPAYEGSLTLPLIGTRTIRLVPKP